MKKPLIKMDYIKKLTDEVGIIQHAKFATPLKKEGYTTDDNSRALIVCTNFLNLYKNKEIENLVDIYLSFLFFMQREDGGLHNFLAYDRKILDDIGSEDCMGRTLWACGNCLASTLKDESKVMAKEIFDKTMKWASNFKFPRSKALSIMGLYYYNKTYPSDLNPPINIRLFANQLSDQFESESSAEWCWFEPRLTYANAQIPHSLLLAYEITGEKRYRQIALKSLEFLLRTQTINEIFVPIGNRGWYSLESERAIYDQQPIEASCTIESLIAAYNETCKEAFLDSALNAFEWFFGKNTKNVEVYNSETGSCFDGITPNGLNLNKGAEANISYLHSWLTLKNQHYL